MAGVRRGDRCSRVWRLWASLETLDWVVPMDVSYTPPIYKHTSSTNWGGAQTATGPSYMEHIQQQYATAVSTAHPTAATFNDYLIDAIYVLSQRMRRILLTLRES